jgi:hypothetical protein
MSRTPPLFHRLTHPFERLDAALHRFGAAKIMVIFSCLYFFLFLPPNLTGAKDANMLAAFQIDEYAQYPVVMRMVKGDPSRLVMMMNFFIYKHYYYGFPFYLTSAIAILPLRIASGLFGESQDVTTLYMAILRQLSPLCMLIAINILVYMWTSFRSIWRSAALFLFLASIPAVFDNNLWWHPDSLVVLFTVLTLFALYKDNLEYGIWFYMAAIFCGISIGTKLIGFWFFLTIVTYLLLGAKKIGYRLLFRYAVLFVILMVATVIATNPLLLIPITAPSIIRTQISQAQMNVFGWGVQMERGPTLWYGAALKSGFAAWWIYAIALFSCIRGVAAKNEKRVLNILILTWSIPFSLYLLFFVANKNERYFLPVMLPLLSSIANPELWKIDHHRRGAVMKPVFTVLLLAPIGIQFVWNVRANVKSYTQTLYREEKSPSIAFYRELERGYFKKSHRTMPLTVFRDPHIYLPSQENVTVHMKWGSATYEDIDEIGPDLILLQKEYITKYSNASTVNRSMEREKAEASFLFYRDAKQNKIKGYHKVVETPFGIAFEKNR